MNTTTRYFQHMIRLSHTALILALALPYLAFAKVDSVHTTFVGPAISSASTTQADPLFPGGSANDHVVSSEAYVKLYFDDAEKIYRNYNWHMQVTYNVTLRFEDGTSRTKNGETIRIDHTHGASNTTLTTKLNTYSNIHSIQIAVQSVQFQRNGTTNLSPIPNDIHLEVGVVTERYYNLNTATVPLVVTETYSAADNTLRLGWNAVTGAEQYDLEWVFVSDGSASGNHTALQHPFDFRNAVRISLSDTEYKISMAYPKGSLIYRVRAVGIDAANGNFDDYSVFSNWSYTPALSQRTVAFAHLTDDVGFPCAYYYTGMQPGMNWQYSSMFAEEGKRKEVASFFDGSLRRRQQVTIQNAGNFAMIGESKYDHFGRPAVSILPAPTTNKGINFYTNGGAPFNAHWGRDQFNRDTHLDASPTNGFPQIMPSNSGAERYYSGSNNLSFENKEGLPLSEGFPYRQTHYTNDGTDRPLFQTGVGQRVNYESGRVTTYIYGRPTQVELDRLFGNEIGSEGHYQKTIVVDPNYQQSVQYIDQNGRIMATALAGDDPAALTPVPDQTTTALTEYFFEGSKVAGQNGAIENTTLLTISNPGNIQFTYNLSDTSFIPCQQGSVQARYDIELEVKDNLDNVIWQRSATDVTLQTWNVTWSNPPLGVYTVRRTLKPNASHRATILQQEYDQIVAAKTTNTCVVYSISGDTLCNTPDCATACDSAYTFWQDGLKHYTDTAGNIYQQDPANTTSFIRQSDQVAFTETDLNAPFNLSIAWCLDMCNADGDSNQIAVQTLKDNCSIRLTMLANDMDVGGQYFDNVPGLYTYNSDGTVVVDTALGEPRYPGHGTLEENIVRNAWLDANVDLNSFLAGLAGMGVDTTGMFAGGWDGIKSNWDPNWSSALIPFHPEYCAYQFFCNYSESCGGTTVTMDDINDFKAYMYGGSDENFAETNSYGYNFLNPLNLNTNTSLTPGSANDESQYINELQSGSYDLDPLFNCRTTANTLSKRAYDFILNGLENFFPIVNNSGVSTGGYYSIWYVMDDPENIAGANGGAGSSNVDPLIAKFFDNLHGDGGCKEGVINSSSSKYLFFRSVYLFLREKAIYDYLDNHHTCADGQPYTHWDKDTNYDGLIDTVPYYALIFPKNPVHQLHSNPHPDSLGIYQSETEGVFLATGGASDNCNCTSFTSYLVERSLYDSVNNVRLVSTQIIADSLLNAFCTDYPPAYIDSILACRTGNFRFASTIPDSLRCESSGVNPFLEDLNTLCSERLGRLAREEAEDRFLADLDAYMIDLERTYDDLLYARIEGRESFYMTYTLGEYHYTLFYYDQAGNRIKMVPPKGVVPLTGTPLANVRKRRQDSAAHNFIHPLHQYVTNYKYNSRNLVREQHTPDGGTSYFWYDREGRIVVSRDAEQATGDVRHSYTLYDGLGRVVETGEIDQPQLMTDLIAENPTDLLTWVSAGARKQVTFTLYDEPIYERSSTHLALRNAFGVNGQQYTRNRVASTLYIQDIPAGTPHVYLNTVTPVNALPAAYLDYHNATHYSYDIHGNVQMLIQEIPELASFGRKYVSVEYAYDLISGNVNELSYQRGKEDEFYHRFTYNSDNRVVKVETSKNRKIWEADARYTYYPHGSLSRMELGDLNVQGLDYAYTIQGWLKAINGATLGEGNIPGTYDLGNDATPGASNEPFAPDAYAVNLSYHGGDFRPITGDDLIRFKNGGGAGNAFFVASRSLYNGNIRFTTTALQDQNENLIDVHANAYRYDQLNRLQWSEGYRDASMKETNNSVTASLSGYKTEYAYDPNGNFTSLQRWEPTNSRFDNLTYAYDSTSANAPKRNRLTRVTDTQGTPTGSDLGNQGANNYQYYANGNLRANAAEQISNIDWNIYGKITEINRTSGPSAARPEFEFHYNAQGERVIKRVKEGAASNSWKTYYYLRDAQGNILAIYLKQRTGGSDELTLEQLDVYGDKRIGVTRKPGNALNDATTLNEEPVSLAPATAYTLFGDGGSTISGSAGTVVTVTSLSGPLTVSGLLESTILSGTVTLNGTTATAPQGASVTIEVGETLTLNASRLLLEVLEAGLNLAGTNTYISKPLNYERVVGEKDYELTNHLGNVLTTVSDRKVWKERTWTTTVFDNTFNDRDPEGWGPYGEPLPDVIAEDEVLVVSGRDRETGAIKTLTDLETCEYNLCLNIRRMDGTVQVVVSDGKNVFLDERIESDGIHCWSLGELSGNISIVMIGLLERDSYFFELDNATLTKTCTNPLQVANVLTTQDYYPFGMVMPGRKYIAGQSDYEYGFNGMLRDDRIKGENNSLDFGARMQDPRVGRFLSLDPRMHDFPSNSAYAFAANNPVYYIDALGEAPHKGPFSESAMVSREGRHIRARRVTTADRIALNTYKNVLFMVLGGGAFGKVVKTGVTAIGLVESAYGAANGGSKEKVKLSQDVGKTVFSEGVEQGGTALGKSLFSNLFLASDIYNNIKDIKDARPTRKETLEDLVFQIALKVYGAQKGGPQVKNFINFDASKYTAKEVENLLNATYNVLNEELGQFNLTETEGINAATEYVNNNFKEIHEKIKDRNIEYDDSIREGWELQEVEIIVPAVGSEAPSEDAGGITPIPPEDM